MSAALSLQQLTSLAGEDSVEIGNPKASAASAFFNDDSCYKLEITDVRTTQSKSDYNQVEVSLSIVDGNGTLAKAGRKWIMLPVFTENMLVAGDPEKLAQLKSIYGKRFHQFLRAVYPETFNVYARCNKSTKSWKFYDEHDNELSHADKRDREKAIGAAVVGAAKALLTEEDLGLVGKRLYYVQSRDKKDPSRTYDNYYSSEPDNYELAPQCASNAIPF
jgi:hypothetical protein